MEKAAAKLLEERLKARGHTFTASWNKRVPGNWRARLQKALEESDAVVIMLSDRGLHSHNVLGEVGMARIGATTKGQLILPVLVGQTAVPHFVNDLQCFSVQTGGATDLNALAEELHEAIDQHLHTKGRAPRLFISHRHKDEAIVRALVTLLESAFRLERFDIRCTSVKPYNLPPGERVSDRLRADLNGAEVVIGVIGPETADSRYVLFELGGAWGRGVPTFPVLVRGAGNQDVPGPLKERHSVSLENVPNCIQLVQDIADETSLERRPGGDGRVAADAEELVYLAAAPTREPEQPPKAGVPMRPTSLPEPPGSDDQMLRAGMHITNYLKAINKGMVSFERIRERINGAYSDAFLLKLVDRSPERFRRARLKGGKPGLALVEDSLL